MDSQTVSLAAFLDAIAGPARAPAAISASAVSAAMGIALFEKALRNPPVGVTPGQGREVVSVLEGLRRRVLELADADVALLEALTAAEAQEGEAAQAHVAAARLAAYRSARRLVDFTIQGLSQVPSTLDWGSTVMLPDIENGWRLLAAAMEGAIACCEDHLKQLEPAFADVETQALRRQGQQGREMVGRAQGALAWRRGKA